MAHKASSDSRVQGMLDDLRRAGLKITSQREAIVQEFASDLTHPTAQELYLRLKPAFPQMSFATVYNTLDALAGAGLSGTLRLGNAARFDPNTTPHHHVVCDRCGAIGDVAAPTLSPSAQARKHIGRAAPGFAIRAVEQIYRGLCASCAAGASAPKTPQKASKPSGRSGVRA
jgi:Fur family peroxide stress response transcriptional regulator